MNYQIEQDLTIQDIDINNRKIWDISSLLVVFGLSF